MAGKKITEMAELTSLATGDLFEVVDVSETVTAQKNKKVQAQTLSTYFGKSSGTASGTDTYTLTTGALSAYVNHGLFVIEFTNANTGASTLNVDSIGAKSIVTQDQTELSAGQIPAGSIQTLIYEADNDNFQCVSLPIDYTDEVDALLTNLY